MADLNSLVIFAHVVEANSFSSAARALEMPLSTVSRRIAELEDRLGVRLIERSTRKLRLTEVGSEMLEYARRSAELSEAVSSIASDHLSRVTGTLRLSSPPSITDSLIAPLAGAFQESFPDLRIRILVTERVVDHIADGVDVAFRLGALKDSALVARRVLRYRHRLVASPAYLAKSPAPENPDDLLHHRLLAFAKWRIGNVWSFERAGGKEMRKVKFEPGLSMNDYNGIACALLSGAGIGELPPIVQPHLLREGKLVEIMPEWRFRPLDLSVVHAGGRHVPRTIRLFEDFAIRFARERFPELPA